MTQGQISFANYPLISKRAKNERCLIWTEAILNTLRHRDTGKIVTLNRKAETSDPSSCPRGQFRPWKVTSSFSAIPLKLDMLEWWKHTGCVQDNNMDCPICSMTFSGQVMKLTWVRFFNPRPAGVFGRTRPAGGGGRSMLLGWEMHFYEIVIVASTF